MHIWRIPGLGTKYRVVHGVEGSYRDKNRTQDKGVVTKCAGALEENVPSRSQRPVCRSSITRGNFPSGTWQLRASFLSRENKSQRPAATVAQEHHADKVDYNELGYVRVPDSRQH